MSFSWQKRKKTCLSLITPHPRERMAHKFELPEVFSDAGGVLKVRNEERVEPPHVTLMHRTKA